MLASFDLMSMSQKVALVNVCPGTQVTQTCGVASRARYSIQGLFYEHELGEVHDILINELASCTTFVSSDKR